MPSKSKLIYLFLLVTVIIFAILTFLVKTQLQLGFDLQVAKVIQSIDLPLFSNLMYGISYLGGNTGGPISFVIVNVICLYKRWYRPLLLINISSIGIGIVAYTIKFLVSRPRPDNLLIQGQDSFPSAHVTYYIGFFGIICWLIYFHDRTKLIDKLAILVMFILFVLVGLSRIYLGVHWFSDVIASYLIGIIWLFLMIHLYNLIRKR